MDKALENLIGALALVVSDRVGDAVADTFGRGGEAPSAVASIGAAPGVSVGELQAVLRLSQPGAARLVDRLVEDGLAEKRSGKDGRQVLVHLTPKGRKLRRKLLDSRYGALAALTEPLSDKERATLTGLLDKMLKPYPACEMDKYQACRMCDQDACTSCPIPAEALQRPRQTT